MVPAVTSCSSVSSKLASDSVFARLRTDHESVVRDDTNMDTASKGVQDSGQERRRSDVGCRDEYGRAGCSYAIECVHVETGLRRFGGLEEWKGTEAWITVVGRWKNLSRTRLHLQVNVLKQTPWPAWAVNVNRASPLQIEAGSYLGKASVEGSEEALSRLVGTLKPVVAQKDFQCWKRSSTAWP